MGSFFQGLFRRQLITYSPEQWSKRLGEKCEKCDKNLTHEKCISLCTCYYFTHEECFKVGFEPQIYTESTDVQCAKCQAFLQMQLLPVFKYEPIVTKWKVFKLAIILLVLLLIGIGILATLNSTIRV